MNCSIASHSWLRDVLLMRKFSFHSESVNSIETTLSHQSRLCIFTAPLSYAVAVSLTPVRGEERFQICCCALLPLLGLRWISHICNTMLVFNGAEAAMSYSALIFVRFLNYYGLGCVTTSTGAFANKMQ